MKLPQQHTVDQSHIETSTDRSLWLATFILRKHWKKTSGKDWKPAAHQNFKIENVVVRGKGPEGIMSRKENVNSAFSKYKETYGSIDNVRCHELIITQYLGEANKNA
jgi:hypothetical protein